MRSGLPLRYDLSESGLDRFGRGRWTALQGWRHRPTPVLEGLLRRPGHGFALWGPHQPLDRPLFIALSGTTELVIEGIVGQWRVGTAPVVASYS